MAKLSPTNALASGWVCIESLEFRAAGILPLWGERLPGRHNTLAPRGKRASSAW